MKTHKMFIYLFVLFFFMNYIFEIIIALIITILFIKIKKPKMKFLFLGYFFLLVSLLLQIPFKYLKIIVMENFTTTSAIPIFILTIITIIISEFTKYFSLKKFLKTKNYKNAILFGIGWVSLESINFFSILVYNFVFSYFSINFNYIPFLNNNFGILNFLFFFIINLSITVLVIISIIKKNPYYLIFGILYSILIVIILKNVISYEKYISMIGIFIYSLYIIFKYNKLK